MLKQKKWEIIQSRYPNTVEDVLNSLLKNRGIVRKSEQKNFLQPKSPFDYSLSELKIKQTEIRKAIKRLEVAKQNKEKIIIFGDYDADGITATAILWECLYGLKFNVMPFIPSRFEDGYGINEESLSKIIEENSDLRMIITVDNGIVANHAVHYANEKGIDVIVTDHHKTNGDLPPAKAVIHTTLTSGSAISWIFAREVEKYFSNKLTLVKKSIELAAIGTVADQLPLLEFNRSLVKFGIASLKNTKRLGLSKLFSIADIPQPELGTYHINFGIAPRINASGRISSGMDGLRLLCTKDKKRALSLAKDLNSLNIERQDLVKNLVGIAEDNVTDERIIIVSHKDFHEGVIGLIASRLVEKYYRPAIVIALDEKAGKASARSIKGFSIVDAINEFRALIIEGGGHDMAAGFSIKISNIEKFKKKINSHFKKTLSGSILSPSIEIDSVIDFNLISWDLFKEISQFEPFGIGNRKPIFMTNKCRIVELKAVGKEKSHLQLKISQNNIEMKGIFFNGGEIENEFERNDYIDIAFQIDENVWNGRSNLQLIIKDVRRSSEQTI